MAMKKALNRRQFLGALGAGAVAVSADARAATRRPNVILIMADDMGFETLRCNGGTSYDSAPLDAIAARGMRFTNCYSQPVCTPSRVKIMTGRSNARNYRKFGDLDPNEITFGHVMKAAGYKTGIAGKWQLTGGVAGTGSFPESSGFDESYMWAYMHDLPGDAKDKYTYFGKKTGNTSRYWNPGIIHNGEYVPTTTDDYGPDLFCGFITDFIERHKDETFFAYYPMALTHGPFQATPLSADQSDAAKMKSDGEKYFGDMVHYTGVLIQRIIDKLEAVGIAENTLVMFTCDNGSGRGRVSMMGARTVHGGKAHSFDTGNHVPFIAYWKGKIAPGGVCNDLVEFSDFLPSIAEVGSAETPKDRVLDGRSFLPQLRGETGNPRRWVVVHYDKDPQSDKLKFRRVRFAYDGRYKLYLDGRMYDVPNDWTEQHPLPAEGAREAIQTARKKLERALETLPEWDPDNSYFKGEADPETKKYLKLHGIVV